jgi:hypothetical protein
MAVDLEQISRSGKPFGGWTYLVVSLAPDDECPVVPSNVKSSNLSLVRQIKCICQT